MSSEEQKREIEWNSQSIPCGEEWDQNTEEKEEMERTWRTRKVVEKEKDKNSIE
jgi:hypothetical protein